ncbi:MAG: carbamate kinase [Tidjanibacter sp.]|nr:carbamate kinase [Tidjanibacter sp.]
MEKLVVIAFGGNALLRKGGGVDYAAQKENVAQICATLEGMTREGARMIIGHGNGPQVGNVLLQHEAGRKLSGVEAMPLDFCVAETQGSLGYMIECGMRNMMATKGIERGVVTVLSQVVVDENDPAFQNPTKPIGPYFTEEEAKELAATKGETYHCDPKGRGWRKVVASPRPLAVHNVELVKMLADAGNVVVTVGGGGVPVVCRGGQWEGLEAVIDKDLALATTAVAVGADEFYILTDIEKVCLNFNTPEERRLDRITIAEAKQYLAEGHFAEGSMAPKIRAAVHFVESSGGECIITDAACLGDPACGTRIVKE